jgi:hypothetical protein
MLLQRLQSLIQFVRTYCLNDAQAKIVSVICWDAYFVDARDSCENGTYVVVIHSIPRDDYVILFLKCRFFILKGSSSLFILVSCAEF